MWRHGGGARYVPYSGLTRVIQITSELLRLGSKPGVRSYCYFLTSGVVKPNQERPGAARDVRGAAGERCQGSGRINSEGGLLSGPIQRGVVP